MQYWWVNQTRNHGIEREKGFVAGEINKRNVKKTHWGRANVKEMKIGDFVVCYRSGIGIDQLGSITKNGAPGKAPWEGCEDRTAYVADVEYYPSKPTVFMPIKREAFWDVLRDIPSCNHKRGPIDLIRGQVRYAYAMKIEKDGFNIIIDLVRKRNLDIENWLQRAQRTQQLK